MAERTPHVLKENESVEIPTRVIYFDGESYVDEPGEDYKERALEGSIINTHRPYLICACFTTPGREKWKDYHGNGFKLDFWRDAAYFTKKKTKTVIFAHNAKYDVLVMGGIKYLLQMGYKLVSYSDDTPFILRFVLPNPKNPKRTDKTIIILSSTNYFMASLASLGDTFQIPKLEAAYNSTDIKEAIRYCRRDVLILKTAMESFLSFIVREDLGNFGLTLASQSFNAFRHRFMLHEIFIHATKEVLILEREAYSGGRTEAWFIGDIPELVYYLDVNSMYPAVMKRNKFPVKLLSARASLTVEGLADFIKRGFLVIAKVKVRTETPLFFKKASKLIFPVGTFWTTLSTPEIIRGLQDGLILEVGQTAIYEATDIFSEFVSYFYGKRLEAKQVNDEVHSYLYKIMLNSLYGKFGQTAIPFERIGDSDKEIIRTERLIDVVKNTTELIKIFGGSVFKKLTFQPGENEAANSFTAIAAHVTAYARMLLYEYIEMAGTENVYYMDTDSIFTNKVGYDILNAKGMVSKGELGKLKLEETCTVTVKGLKDYVKDGKVKLKGIPKNALQVDENTYIVNRWMGLPTAIREGNVDGYKNVSMVKRLSRIYDKGIVTESGRVLPIKLEE